LLLRRGECHVALALHACGNATDLALLQAQRAKAAFIVNPCCIGNLKFSIPGGKSSKTPSATAAQPVLQKFAGSLTFQGMGSQCHTDDDSTEPKPLHRASSSQPKPSENDHACRPPPAPSTNLIDRWDSMHDRRHAEEPVDPFSGPGCLDSTTCSKIVARGSSSCTPSHTPEAAISNDMCDDVHSSEKTRACAPTPSHNHQFVPARHKSHHVTSMQGACLTCSATQPDPLASLSVSNSSPQQHRALLLAHDLDAHVSLELSLCHPRSQWMAEALPGHQDFQVLARAADFSHIEGHGYPKLAALAKVTSS
jgi:hypothetical protein